WGPVVLAHAVPVVGAIERHPGAEPRDEEQPFRLGKEPEPDRAGPDRLDFGERGAPDEQPQFVATIAKIIIRSFGPSAPAGVVGLADLEPVHRSLAFGLLTGGLLHRVILRGSDRPARRGVVQRCGGPGGPWRGRDGAADGNDDASPAACLARHQGREWG